MATGNFCVPVATFLRQEVGKFTVDKQRTKLLLLLGAVAVAVFIGDQATKVVALKRLLPGENRPLLGKLLSLELVHNSGAAFSLGAGYTWVLTAITAAVVVAIVWAALRVKTKLWAVALGVLLGGGLGNLYDRLFRPPSFGQGHVVDFISYGGQFVGNVADIAIVVGAGVLLLLLLFPARAVEEENKVEIDQ